MSKIKFGEMATGFLVTVGLSLTVIGVSEIKYGTLKVCFMPEKTEEYFKECEKDKKTILTNEVHRLPDKVEILENKKPKNLSIIFNLSGFLFICSGAVIYSYLLDNEKDNAPFKIQQMMSKMRSLSSKLQYSEQIELLDSQLNFENLKGVILKKYQELKSFDMSETEIEHYQNELTKQSEVLSLEHDYRLVDLRKRISQDTLSIAQNEKKIKDLNSNDSGENSGQLKKIIEKMKSHENGWLWQIVDSRKPLWLTGAQGSGKSFFAAAVVKLRYLIHGWELESITDSHYHQNSIEGKAWYQIKGLAKKIYGSNQNWTEIAIGMTNTLDRWKVRTENDPIIQSIFDEFTKYKHNEESAEAAKLFIPSIVSDPRKANEAVIMIAHGNTNAIRGGVEGYSEAIDENTISINLFANNKGEKPTGKGKIYGLKNQDGELIEELKVTIPKWFHVDKFNNLE